MIFGMTPLTFIHVAISLLAILSGVAVLFGLLGSKRTDGWTAFFLATTVLTSVTGYFFPFHKLLPSHIIGAISLVVLAIAIIARYSKQMAGSWRNIYVISAMIAFYLNVFVFDCPGFHESPGFTYAGSDPIGTAFPCCAIGGNGCVHRSDCFCG